MPPGPVLGFDDPDVGIEADFPGEALFHDGRIHTVWEYLNNVYSHDKFDLTQL